MSLFKLVVGSLKHTRCVVRVRADVFGAGISVGAPHARLTYEGLALVNLQGPKAIKLGGGGGGGTK